MTNKTKAQMHLAPTRTFFLGSTLDFLYFFPHSSTGGHPCSPLSPFRLPHKPNAYMQI